MQHLLFLAVIAGALFVVDDLHFNGQYRSEIWQQATYAGRSFSRTGVVGRPVVSFSFETRAEAEYARQAMQPIIAKAKLVTPHTG
jgi:hypothetical protein